MAAGLAPRQGGVAQPPGLGAGGPRASHLVPPGLFLYLWKGEGLGKYRMMCLLQSVIWGSLGQGVEGFCLRTLAYVRERREIGYPACLITGVSAVRGVFITRVRGFLGSPLQVREARV